MEELSSSCKPPWKHVRKFAWVLRETAFAYWFPSTARFQFFRICVRYWNICLLNFQWNNSRYVDLEIVIGCNFSRFSTQQWAEESTADWCCINRDLRFWNKNSYCVGYSAVSSYNRTVYALLLSRARKSRTFMSLWNTLPITGKHPFSNCFFIIHLTEILRSRSSMWIILLAWAKDLITNAVSQIELSELSGPNAEYEPSGCLYINSRWYPNKHYTAN